RLREGYDPGRVLETDPMARRAIEYLKQGVNGVDFSDLVRSLTGWGQDTYMTLADFADYHRAQQDVQTAFADHERFNRMSLMNIAGAGIFSSDRSVREYCDNIWNAKSIVK
ncbi:MAG: glycogen/starch/alpha-glucan phosphorylase, partial [Clostridia bacterium]|nr:glycogen/starch/alpha-glucan phosphorylase [Clostridia bacterium]